MVFPDFVGGSYENRSLNADAQRCLNLYPETIESGSGKNKAGLYLRPGLGTPLVTIPNTPIRALYMGENRLFAVAGQYFFEVFSDGTYQNRGSVGNDNLPAQMAFNGNQVIIASAGTLYVDNGGGPNPAQFSPAYTDFFSGTSNVFTDLYIGSSANLVGSNSYSFVGSDVGKILFITSGIGFTTGQYTIASVSGGIANVTIPAGALTSTGGTGTEVIPGALDLLGSVSAPFGADDIGRSVIITGGVNFITSTYTVLSVTNGIATMSSNVVAMAGATGGTGAELVPAVQCDYLDTFFVAMQSYSSALWFASASLDGTTWDASNVVRKDGYPDALAGIRADHEYLWLFGDGESTEIWQDSGGATFPFSRYPGALIHYGCQAPYSHVRLQDGVAFLAVDRERGGCIAFYGTISQVQRISNHAIESAWQGYATVQDAVAYSMIFEGHHWWVINFPTANATWVFDATTGYWHEEGYYNGAGGVNRNRVAFHAYGDIQAHGSNLTGIQATHWGADWQSGNIYPMGPQYVTDNGEIIMVQRACPHVSNEQKENFFHRIQLDTQVQDANMVYDWSQNGGQSYVTGRTPSVLGSPSNGEAARQIWNECGMSRDRIHRLTSIATQEQFWVNMYMEMTPGTS